MAKHRVSVSCCLMCLSLGIYLLLLTPATVNQGTSFFFLIFFEQQGKFLEGKEKKNADTRREKPAAS